QASRERALRGQRDRRHLFRACAGTGPGRRDRRDTRSRVARGADQSVERAAAPVETLLHGRLVAADPVKRLMRVTLWLEELRRDLKFAFRQLKSSPAFTLVATLTLALGICRLRGLRGVPHESTRPSRCERHESRPRIFFRPGA